MEILFIITAQRHAGTTLLKLFNDQDNICKMDEEFTRRVIKNRPSGIDLSQHLENEINKYEWTRNHMIVIKILPDCNITVKELSVLDHDVFFLFLTRNLKDSYASFRKSCETGNWGHTPEEIKYFEQTNNTGYIPNKIPRFHRYRNTINTWFSSQKNYLVEINKSYKEITFDMVTSKNLNIKGLLK
jgi:hypothetical protein